MKTKLQAVGIDVSKRKLDLGLIFSLGKTKTLQVSNDYSGILSLIEVLETYQEIEDIPIVIEATGGYHYGITFQLIEKGWQAKVINPLITQKHTKAQIRKVKTDKKDALLLAKIGLLEELRSFNETKLELQLKRKVKLFHFLSKQLQQVNGRISSTKDSGLRDEFQLKVLSQTKENLKVQLAEVKQEILGSLTVNCPKIVGVSDFNLKAIVAELGNVKRFSNHKQIIAFAGLDPSVRESGSSVRGKSYLSKRGSKTLRLFLFQSAWGVMMHNDKYREYYQEKKKEGKHYYTCLTAIARKLLCEIYFNLKEHSYCIKG